MPRKPTLWSAWNYHISSFSRACLTANMTEVMDITDFDKPILATLNPNPEMFPKGTTATFYFRHPIYDNLTAQAQHDMEQIQGKRGVWYAGAWMGHGFHEDGFTKGVEAAMQIRRQIEPNFSQDSVFPLKDWKNAERRTPVHTAIKIKKIFPGTRHGIVFFFSLILGLLLFLKP